MRRSQVAPLFAAFFLVIPAAVVAETAPVLLAQARPAPQQADDDDPIEKCALITQAPRALACLKGVLADAEKAVDALVKKAGDKIAKHQRLPAPEKENWRAIFAETQATWRKFVELDCQGAVARETFGAPTAEATIVACKASAFRARANDLETRFDD
jgi:uncharacterized protein YecT (DUF1311 family)